MQINNLVRKIITEVLFGTSYEELSPQWQAKIEQTVLKLSADVIRPMQLMNSTLMEMEQKSSRYNTSISNENLLLQNRIKKLKAILFEDPNSKNKSA